MFLLVDTQSIYIRENHGTWEIARFSEESDVQEVRYSGALLYYEHQCFINENAQFYLRSLIL